MLLLACTGECCLLLFYNYNHFKLVSKVKLAIIVEVTQRLPFQ